MLLGKADVPQHSCMYGLSMMYASGILTCIHSR